MYYHSYHLLKYLGETNATLLLTYFTKVVTLLEHYNSYHRNYGMDIMTSMVPHLSEGDILSFLTSYLDRLFDEKISTRKYCITYAGRIMKYHSALAEAIIDSVLKMLQEDDLTTKHKSLLQRELLKQIKLSKFVLEPKQKEKVNPINLGK